MKEKVNNDSVNMDNFSGSYSEDKFWSKITNFPSKAGCSVLRSAITLYVLLTEANLPVLGKISVFCALGYFIAPVDLIPDFLPGGFVDDLAVMSTLLSKLQIFSNDNIEDMVNNYLPEYCRGQSIIE